MGKNVILVLLSITPLPKINPTSKISPWKNGLELLPYVIIARKTCVFHARLLNGHFVFFWLNISFFWCLCLFSGHQKNPQTLQLVRSPALSNVVRISQVGTRIKLEVLIIIPVRLSNRCEFIWFALYLFYMIPESTQERRHSTKNTRETRASAKIAWGVKTWCARYEHVHVWHVRVFFLLDYSWVKRDCS